MSSPLIFITGITGLVGGATALEALEAGYRLRVALRKESQIDKVKKIYPGYLDRLEFVIIPDISKSDAYEGKLNGVEYVLHIASPLAKGTNKDDYFPPAVGGTLAILEEAHKTKSIKKVVITASVLSIIPITGVPEGGVVKEDNDWSLEVDPSADFTGPNEFATAFTIYHASKLLADSASRKFMATHNPSFSLVTIHPGFIYGENIMQLTAEELGGTNSLLFNRIMNNAPLGGTSSVHVKDVAAAHVKALKPEIPNGAKYLLIGPEYTWADVVEVLKRKYPDVDWKLEADAQAGGWAKDTTKAERELGIKWRSVEEQVSDVLDQQLRLLKESAQ